MSGLILTLKAISYIAVFLYSSSYKEAAYVVKSI